MKDKQIKILIVDDEESLRRNIEKTLKRAGYAVEMASNISVVPHILDASTFDLVLLDLVMPDWTGKLSKTAGFQLLEKIRELGYDMPIIMLTATAHATSSTETQTTHKAQSYLIKGSISQRDLVNVIENTLNEYNIT